MQNSPVTSEQNRSAWLQALGGMLAPLRLRDYSLLFSGQLVSNVGDAFYAVALPWFMLSSGGGAQDLGIVLTAYGVPRVGGVLLGGPLSDRLRPRRLMLLSDTFRLFLTGALAALVLIGQPALWLLCLVSAFLGIFSGLFTPPAWAVVPDILSDADLQAGNALTTSSMQIASFIGSGVAGIVVARFQSGIAFVIDALSFVVSAVTLALMRNGRAAQNAQIQVTASKEQTISAEASMETVDAPASTMTFWQLLRSSRLLQVLLVMIIFMNLGNGAAFEVALPVLARNSLHAGASGYGLILAGFSIGAFVGALCAGALGKIPYRGLVGLGFFFVQACAFALIPFLPNVASVTAIMILAGVLNGLGNVISITLIQQALPRHLMGRIMGAIAFMNFGFYPLSVAFGGFFVAHSGPTLMFVAEGVLIAVPALFGLFQREFKEL